jgi:hypothetical protein
LWEQLGDFTSEHKPKIAPKAYYRRITRYRRAELPSSFRSATFSSDLGITEHPVSQSSRKQGEKTMSFQFAKWTVLPAAALLLGTVAFGQDTNSTGSSTQGTTTTAPAPKPTIAQRKENQQDRIANGVQSGQLTAGETSKLETKEAAINGETRADRAANGGKVREQSGGPAPRKSAGPHRAGN